MNNRKNQNSILFLTTLGVYLGLLVVGGAAPQIFAHSATTRNFELVDEIEVKDDLDNKPTDCEEAFEFASSKSASYGGRADAMTEYGQIIGRLFAASLNTKFDTFSLGDLLNFEDRTQPKFLSNYSGKPVLFPSGTRTEIDAQLEKLLGIVPLGESSEKGVRNFAFGWVPQTIGAISDYNRIDRYDAHRLFVSLRASLDLAKCRVVNPAEKLILDNSDIRQNDSVIRITTQLPRSGLDALLAKNAK